ncbi:MAG TPA: UDP-3-O-(3-hydroxymyristoyl)glucosamine N-acyltransferase [Verrucomicrobiae bacterium]|nr:UDP-3-O-(3-hydroxymyristoyl)glucosamine N-acyltransferase [Verrucomicrobiae bacterium]
MSFTAAEIAKHLEGEVLGDGQTQLKAFAPVDRAKAGELTFAENDEFFAKAEQGEASAIIVSGINASSNGKVLIRVKNARVAFARALTLFFPEPCLPAGIHSSATIAASANVHKSVYVGPNCVIGDRVRIGAGVVLHGGVVVGDDCEIGDGTVLFPNVTLYARSQLGQRVRIHAGTIVGSDGFGYVLDGGVHRKIPQVGNVIIGDDVEIGANATIDRGALGPTVIGKGTKIDNLVQIAHNVQIGEHCIVISQAGVAGSTQLGNYVILAGQAGIAGHLKLGNKVTVGAQAGVMTDIPDGQMWLGSPAQPDKQTKRQMIAVQHLPELLRRVTKVEKKLGLNREPEKE